MYKSDKYKVLKNIPHEEVLLEDYLKRPEKLDTEGMHVQLKDNYSEMFFKFVQEKKLIDGEVNSTEGG